MSRACKVVGTTLSVLGVLIAASFTYLIVTDAEYRSAALARERNPGNIMYEAELGKAQIRRGFEAVGMIVGILLIGNGATLVGLGVLAGRVPRLSQSASDV